MLSTGGEEVPVLRLASRREKMVCQTYDTMVKDLYDTAQVAKNLGRDRPGTYGKPKYYYSARGP